MKIISGGQTGVDQIALRVGRSLGYETGGVAPKGYKTEVGSMRGLLQSFGLIEHNSEEYNPRTEMNVMWGCITLIFGDTNSRGSLSTKGYCKKHTKHYLLNPTIEMIRTIVGSGKIKILNIAGNRRSNLSKLSEETVINTLTEGLKKEYV